MSHEHGFMLPTAYAKCLFFVGKETNKIDSRTCVRLCLCVLRRLNGTMFDLMQVVGVESLKA